MISCSRRRMKREVAATVTIPAGTTVAATVRLTRGTAGHAVQRTPWIAVTGDTAKAAPPTDDMVSTPPLINATDRPTALLTALLTARPTAHITTTGPPTALGTIPLPDAMHTPQSPTAETPPQRDRAVATRSPTGMRPY